MAVPKQYHGKLKLNLPKLEIGDTTFNVPKSNEKCDKITIKGTAEEIDLVLEDIQRVISEPTSQMVIILHNFVSISRISSPNFLF